MFISENFNLKAQQDTEQFRAGSRLIGRLSTARIPFLVEQIVLKSSHISVTLLRDEAIPVITVTL